MTLLYLALAWAVGIILARDAFDFWPPFWWGMAAAALLGAILVWQKGGQRIALLCLLLAALGALRVNAVQTITGPQHVAQYNGRGWRAFEGIIVEAPDVRDTHINLCIEADAVLRFEQRLPITGVILAQAARYGDYAYGDRVRVAGSPLTPPEFDDFSYREYLARQQVYTLINNAQVDVLSRGHGEPLTAALLGLRTQAGEVIGGALPEPQAGLLTGILLGVETGIAPDVRAAFNTTGATHIIAISGFNMTLIASLISRALFLLLPGRRRTAVLVSLTAIAIYTLFVGVGASVVRAAVMSSLLIVAPLAQRKPYVPASLAFAALLMSALDPLVLWDVGFQLSFAAVLGLALFTEPLERAFRRLLVPLFRSETVERLLRLLSEPLIVTLAAQITTLPLIVLYFGRLSVASLAVNLLILPVQAPLLILGALATLIGLLVPALAKPVFWADLLLLTWTVAVVRAFAGVPGASFAVQTDERAVALFFLGVAAWTILQGVHPGWWKAAWVRLRALPRAGTLRGAALASGAVVVALLWAGVFSLPDGLLHVHFLDMGHSNAVLIRTPGGAQLLVDGGEFPTRLLTALGDHLPFWDRAVEVLVITQPKSAQIAALPAVLDRYTVGQAITNGQQDDFADFAALEDTLIAHGINVLPVAAGYRLTLSDGVTLDVLHPQESPPPGGAVNSYGLVLRLSYGDISFLLTPDLDEEAERALLDSGQWLGATVLQLAAHGSNRASSEAFLAAVEAQIAVLQADAGNRYGHPAPEVLERLGDVPLYRTDTQGEITFSTDSETLWITIADGS